MIYVRLKGGLGNQLFQYATGLRLARKHNTELKLDASIYKDDPLRFYALNAFNVSAQIATDEELEMVKPRRRKTFLWLASNSNNSSYPVLTEKYFHVDQKILDAPDNVYLDGHWQSEKYFKEIEDIIRKEFSFKGSLDEKNKNLLDEIENATSVSVHVRRGDYVTNTRLPHQVCDLDYYARCAEIICKHRENARFYVFTDDTKWAAENLHLPSPMTIVEGNQDAQSYKDMWLMSVCRDNIIANSSFSWWSAWLNANPTKIVLAPKHWFKKSSFDTADLIPEDWQRV
jgi:Glycosyl transferase family 11